MSTARASAAGQRGPPVCHQGSATSWPAAIPESALAWRSRPRTRSPAGPRILRERLGRHTAPPATGHTRVGPERMVMQEALAGFQGSEVADHRAARLLRRGDLECVRSNHPCAQRRRDAGNRSQLDPAPCLKRPGQRVGALRFHRNDRNMRQTVASQSLDYAGHQRATAHAQRHRIECHDLERVLLRKDLNTHRSSAWAAAS